MNYKLAVSIFLLSLSMADAHAGYEAGQAALQRGDYTAALKEFQPLAKQGNPKAQLDLGSMYKNGQGVAKNQAEAMKWYRRAADQGYAPARNALKRYGMR